MSYDNFVQVRAFTPFTAGIDEIILYDVESPYRLPPESGGRLVIVDSVRAPSHIEVISYTHRLGLALYGVTRGELGTTARAWSGTAFLIQPLMVEDYLAALDTKVDKVTGKGLSTEDYTTVEKGKLSGIATGATANATDAQLRDRATHTGTQAMSTVSGLDTSLAGKVDNTDSRLTDSREWTASEVSQVEAEAGIAITVRKWTSQRVRQAAVAWWNGITSAWGRGFVASANAAAGRSALELGTAAMANVQTSATDTTGGALMDVGAFGNGGILDLRGSLFENGTPADLFGRGTVSGFANGGPDGLNIPAITGNIVYGILSVYGHWRDASGAAGAASREFLTTTGRSFLQTHTSGSWNPWREVFTTGNILGTVSQSGGVPTGAIIQRGSNANGEFVRYADGTQICTQAFAGAQTAIAYGSLFRCAVPWTFPAAFSAAPSGSGGGVDQATSGFVGGSTSSNSSATFSYFTITGSVTASNIRLLAIGRWF